MTHTRFYLSLALGLFAGLADYLGGFLLVRRSPSARALRYFVALGAGFMLAAALLEMLPEAFAVNAHWAAPLILAGYCGVHLLEHTLVPHFHFGEETHAHEFLSKRSSYSVLLGLATHTFFDGIAIGSGFVLSAWLGWVLFIAIFLHKIPEGFTVASVMLAGGQGRRAALNSALFLGATTVLGVLAINLEPTWVRAGLPLSAGVTIYVAATDLVPEVNREPGVRMALVFFLGVILFFLLRTLAPAQLCPSLPRNGSLALAHLNNHGAPMPRYCLTLDLQDDPHKIAEYKRHHEKIWPEIRDSLYAAGVTAMEIYLTGTRMFMIMDVNDTFSLEKKAAMDRANPKVAEWEALMANFQAVPPGADPVRRWAPMEKVFDLSKQ